MKSALHDLILLKGAPGVGKSTAARLLAGHFASGVRIEVDTLRGMVINVKWTDQAEHRTLLKLSAQLAGGFLRSGFAPVILIDTFSGDKVDGFLAALRLECPRSRVFVAVLHASDDVLRHRVLSREAEAFRNITIAKRINRESVDNARPFETLIDTSSLAPTHVARAILAAMQERRSRSVDATSPSTRLSRAISCSNDPPIPISINGRDQAKRIRVGGASGHGGRGRPPIR